MRSWLLLLAVLATFQPIVQVASTEDSLLSSTSLSSSSSSTVNRAANEFLKAIKENYNSAIATTRTTTEEFKVNSKEQSTNTALVERNTELMQRTNFIETRTQATSAYEKSDSDNNNNNNNNNNNKNNNNKNNYSKQRNSDSDSNNISDNSENKNNNNNHFIIEIKNIEEREGNQIYYSDDLQKSQYKMPEVMHRRTHEQQQQQQQQQKQLIPNNNLNEINKINEENNLVAIQSERNLARTFSLVETETTYSEHNNKQNELHNQHQHHHHQEEQKGSARKSDETSESEELHHNQHQHHNHHRQHHHQHHHHHHRNAQHKKHHHHQKHQQQQQQQQQQQNHHVQQQHSSNSLIQQKLNEDAALAESQVATAATVAPTQNSSSDEGSSNQNSLAISNSDISSSFLNSINNENNNNNNNKNNENENKENNMEIAISLDNSDAIIDETNDGSPATYSNKEIIGDKIKPDPKILVEIENSLLSLFNMKRPPKIDRSKIVIPEAMKKLYAQVTGHDLDSVNIPKPGLLTKSANTVRSFTHQESKIDDRFPHHHRFRLYFDIKSIPSEEKLKAAELQLSRDAINSVALNSREANRTRYQVLAYDITRVGIRGKREPSYLLLDNKTVRLNSTEPVSLDVQPAVNRWLASPKKNYGLLIEVRTMRSLKPAPHHHVRLRRSAKEAHEQWQHKQPLLFTYTDDGRHKSRSIRDVSSRSKRAREHHKRSHRRKNTEEICRRHSLYVDFSDVGWSDWIVAPPGYDAYYCHGRCPFPLADHLNSTNHAVVQTLVNNINPGKVPKACCVPTELEGISMLYLNDQSTVVLKNYQDMTVVGCGCR